jgi:hypothetical protein
VSRKQYYESLGILRARQVAAQAGDEQRAYSAPKESAVSDAKSDVKVQQAWTEAVVVKAVVKLQASVRRSRARKAMVAYMQANGTLLSMPGTVQGKSGWYEYNDNGALVVVKYDVTEEVKTHVLRFRPFC